MRAGKAGLEVQPGGFFIDPIRPSPLAVVSHGHADHARPGHDHVIATPETLAIMQARYGEGFAGRTTPLAYGETVSHGPCKITLMPAGHVLGSAQIRVEYQGDRIVYSGDYKCEPDPTCAAFTPVPCDVFITEATFALPVFHHPPVKLEIEKLLTAREQAPDRALVVGAYALGKAQRVIRALRDAGYDRPVYIHGALANLCALYQAHGIDLGELLPATAGERGRVRQDLRGEIVIAPPGALADRWSRRLPDPLVAMASGWMQIMQRARQRGVELPLIISDHADWDDLLTTIDRVGPEEVWVTHGREEALIRALALKGIKARALALIGYEDEAE
jgi:putative mRNA 3-end processing factor